jgi:hypothetical protein
MPIALNHRDTTNVLEVVMSGKLSHEDYERFVPEVETMVRKYRKIRVLVDMIDFHGWEPHALWDDTKFAFKHFNDISRIAMVGDTKWELRMAQVCRLFSRAEIRYYDWTKLREARAWIDAPRKETLKRVPATVSLR